VGLDPAIDTKELHFGADARETLLRGTAVSVASTLLLTEATMTDIPEKHASHAERSAGGEMD
jgi:hypothetical protein